MEEVKRYIPHRSPFLFVDRIVEFSGNKIKTQRKVSLNEPYFQGHFPERPIMPGVLICEFVFQSGAILAAMMMDRPKSSLPVITRIRNVRIKHPVYPGDLMDGEVCVTENTSSAFRFEGKVLVEEKKILTVQFAAMLSEGL